MNHTLLKQEVKQLIQVFLCKCKEALHNLFNTQAHTKAKESDVHKSLCHLASTQYAGLKPKWTLRGSHSSQ